MKNGVRRTGINVAGVAKNNNVDIEVDRLSNYQAYKTDTAGRYKENHLAVMETIVPISARRIANKSSFKFKSEQIERVVREIERSREAKA